MNAYSGASPSSVSAPAVPDRYRRHSTYWRDIAPEYAGFRWRAARLRFSANRPHLRRTESATAEERTRPSAGCDIQGAAVAPVSSPSPFCRQANAGQLQSRFVEYLVSGLPRSLRDRVDRGTLRTGAHRGQLRARCLPLPQCGRRRKAARPDTGCDPRRFLSTRWVGLTQFADNRRYIFLTCRFSS